MFEVSQRVRSVSDNAPGTVASVDGMLVTVNWDDGQVSVFANADKELKPYGPTGAASSATQLTPLGTAQDLALSYARKAGWLQSHMEHALWMVGQIKTAHGSSVEELVSYRIENLETLLSNALARIKDM